MLLTLDRPLLVPDVETHAYGRPETLRITELGFLVIYPDDRPPVTWSSLVDPLLPITAEATTTHGITDAMVQSCKVCGLTPTVHTDQYDHPFSPFPTFAQLAPRLVKGFSDCDFCGYNVRFDLSVLTAEFARVEVPWSTKGARLLDAHRLWSLASPRRLEDAVRDFLRREPTTAHRAAGDAQDAWDVTLAILTRFDQLPRDLQALHDISFPKDAHAVDADSKFVWTDAGEVLCNFGGKSGHKGKLLCDMPTGYLEWMLKPQNNFSDEVKLLVVDALRGVYPVRS